MLPWSDTGRGRRRREGRNTTRKTHCGYKGAAVLLAVTGVSKADSAKAGRQICTASKKEAFTMHISKKVNTTIVLVSRVVAWH